jgi:acyl transferase domain-containing protein/acyl carrier protein
MTGEQHDQDRVAIVGVACRFPGAADYREYWHNLANGVESITFLTDDELRTQGVEEWEIDSPDYVKVARVVDDMECFDARFFGYTAREAEVRDPQGRLFLETCYAALEDAGYDIQRYGGTVGVFGGMGVNDYWTQNVGRNAAAVDGVGSLAIQVSNGVDYLTTTVSHRLDLRGPSVDIQSACSTSLVAIHLACQSLRAGDCGLALVGGVEVQLPYRTGYRWYDGGLGSRDGHCRAFDMDASGTIFGTGVGAVLLKRLADARADGDYIYAVVRGSAINNDGAARPAFTAPGVDGQAELVTAALAAAGVKPEEVGYVEAHGTGTPVGDPVEIAALTRAFRDRGDRSRGRCLIGSAKPNVGHLGAAAGMAGLIKVCLAFQHEALPPSINFDRPNPRIDFDDSPFAVNAVLTPWPRGDRPRLAGVSAFGIGGTNAHVVLEEPPAADAGIPARQKRHLLVVSAKTPAALDCATRRLADHLAERSDLDLAKVAYTLQTGRGQFAHRRAVVVGSGSEASAALIAATGGGDPARPRAVAYLFPGQGAQYPGMGRDLYGTEQPFRDAVDRCAEQLVSRLGVDLRSVLFPDELSSESASADLRETWLAQPALFTVEYAVAETLRSWGLQPEAMLGHSIGEWVAAHLAGVFSLPDALALVAERGRLMQTMPAGAMLAVPIPEDQVADLLIEGVEIAAANAPHLTVVSGPVDAVELFGRRLERLAVATTRLHTSHAFHSASMAPILDQFGEAVAAVARSAPRVPFVSNVTGTWTTPEQAVDPQYWARQLREPVRFADGVRTLIQAPNRLLVEVGPGASLSNLARRTTAGADVPVIATMPDHRRPVADATLVNAIGQMWIAGVTPDWDRYWREARPGRTPLPAYPFERRRYWLDPDNRPATRTAGTEPRVLPIQQAFFSTRWQERSLPPLDTPSVEPRWLVFSAGGELLEALCDRLVAAGARVSVAVPGAELSQVSDDRFTVRPAEPADLGRLLALLAAADGVPTRIIHGFAVSEAVPDPVAPDTVVEASDNGFYSLLHLAQEVSKHRGEREVQLFALTSNGQDVTGGEQLEPAKAMILGPSLLIGRELPGVRCRAVDVELPSTAPPATVAAQLFAELVSGAEQPQVAWRGRKRWVWDFETVPLDAPDGVPAALREQGVYLIPGGLGGVGLAVAKELARLVRARLVLVGRTPVPAREQWPALLSDPTTPERVRQLLQQLREIEAAGGELMVRCGDITDEPRLAAIVDEAVARFGAMHGVFHAAGIAGGGMLAVRSRRDAEKVLAPKVAGTLALHRVLGGRVDFIILFSSIAAVVGNFGLVDYVAANNFQDAFARRAAARGERVYSIGWDLWRGQGMAALVDTVPMIVRELQSGARSEPVAHPLLDRRIYDRSGDIVLSTVLRPGSHWILNDHMIGDVPVVPGTAAVELIRAAYAEAVGGPVELRDVIFARPITVTGPTELRTVLRPAADGFDVSVVVSDATASFGSGSGTVHVTAHVRAGEAAAPPLHDLVAIRKRCDRETLDYSGRHVGLVSYGEHWHNVGTVHVGDGEQIAQLELDPRFSAECEEYVLHPGLFDDAVSNTQHLPELADSDSNFLPLSYGRIVIRAALPPAFMAHVRHRDAGERNEVTVDVVLIDEAGQELVRVERYSLRRVDPAAILPEHATASGGPSTAAAHSTSTEPATGETADWTISEPTAMDALGRILHHLPKPHLVVSLEGLGRSLHRIESLTGDLLAEQISEASLPAQSTGERMVDTPFAAPEDELQELLVGLLQNALGVQPVGIDDDFFELGGNSLVAVQLGFRVRELFEVDVPIASLLEQPTVRGLAAAMDHVLRAKAAAMTPAEVETVLDR